MTVQTIAVPPRVRGGRHRARRRALPWRLLFLHPRARQLGWAIVGLAAVALVGWWMVDALAHRGATPDAAARLPAVVALPLVGAIIASIGLGGADEELERSTAWRWRAARAVHVLVVAVTVAAVVGSIGPWEPSTYGTHEIVRKAVACVGVVAASAVILGARLAWAPIFAYVVTVYFTAPRPLTNGTALWTWPVQPSGSPAAWTTAMTLFVLGMALYTVSGPRPTSTRDE
ncbi:MAG: hypothetical protein ACRDWI_15070 [Jiangellaceae bacterium]